MRRALLAIAAAAALTVPVGAGAEHAGCLATTAEPTCSYTAIGSHTAAGFSQGGFEASVMRVVNGVETKVVVGSHSGGATATSAIAAAANEVVTLTLLPGAQGILGAISAGNTSGHP